ncbi:MAG: GTP-binding protein [Clostridiales bacterium]|nr:GTP-binding protein [Clostridiales bacterium]
MIIDVVIGFLGSGKTTFMLGVITALSHQQKLAVIVNEFGDIGIDGTVLKEYDDTEVVELASGCICCSLSKDLVAQVEMIACRFAPDRLLIEPSGVATVASLLMALRSLKLEQYVDEIRIICILDAVNFSEFYTQNRLYVEAQLRAASLVIINKADLSTKEAVVEVRELAASLNANAVIVTTTYCRVLTADYLSPREIPENFIDGNIDAGTGQSPVAHGLEKISMPCNGSLRFAALDEFLRDLQRGEFGNILRAKGIVHTRERGWVLFNLASGYISFAPLRKPQTAGKIFVLGNQLARDAFFASLDACDGKEASR